MVCWQFRWLTRVLASIQLSSCYFVRDSSGLWDSGKIRLLRKSALSWSDMDCNSWSITCKTGDMMTFQWTVYLPKMKIARVPPRHNRIPESSDGESWQRAAREVWTCHNRRLWWKWALFWKVKRKGKLEISDLTNRFDRGAHSSPRNLPLAACCWGKLISTTPFMYRALAQKMFGYHSICKYMQP